MTQIHLNRELLRLSALLDEALRAMRDRGRLAADEAGLNIKVVTFTEAKDTDELIKNVGLKYSL